MQRHVLIISDCPTHPTNAGNRSCQLSYCNLLKELGYMVSFLYISPKKDKTIELPMKEYWRGNLYIYETPYIQQIVQKAIFKFCKHFGMNTLFMDLFCPWFVYSKIQGIVSSNKIDSIIINYIWLSRIFTKVNVRNKIIFTHDVFSNRRLKGKSQWFSFSPNAESKALNRCHKILAIQNNEATYFQYLSPCSRIFTVYTPFQFHYPKTTGSMNLLFFSGGNEHNLSGLNIFLNNVFPVIQEKYPKIKLIIGGGICGVIDKKKLNNSIVLKGYVKDPADFYKEGDIVINPVQEGTGLKIKTFEAISYGKIVLAHSHSFVGIFRQNDVPMFCCNNANDYLFYLNQISDKTINPDTISGKCKEYIAALNGEIKKSYLEALS